MTENDWLAMQYDDQQRDEPTHLRCSLCGSYACPTPENCRDVDDGDYIAERIAERDDIPPTPFD